LPDPGTPVPGTVPFTLDGRPATARPGEVIISAAERAGTYIPRFCYHPRMKPVGMCRMCLVEVSGPRGATLQPACFVSVNEGMEVVTCSPKVKKAQDGVLEFLLVNHPLDCPVCDKGGECPLQDQTLAYGPGESRFVEEKRHFEKPIAISDLVLLDRERCIQCARCTRFAEEIAGEAQIDFAGRGERVEVATFPERPFTSYFSGNTVQICPVGALTATPYRFTARPWDLDQVESTCTTCAFGCRAAVQSSTNRLTRLLGIDADPVNQGWLCDKGRFVFESVNGDEIAGEAQPAPVADEAVDVVPATAAQIGSLQATRGQFMGEVAESREVRSGRIAEPMLRKDDELVAVSWGEALAATAEGIARIRDESGPGAIAMIGGARCTNEGAYAWSKLAKSAIGTDSVDAQLGDGLPAELVLSLPRATIDEACRARAVVLLSGDIREELPVLFLRLREAVTSGRTALVEISPVRTSVTDLADVSLRPRPGDLPSLVEALVADGPGTLPAHPHGPSAAPEEIARARALLGAKRHAGGPAGGAGGQDDRSDGPGAGDGVVVVLGRPSLSEHELVIAHAARVLARNLPGARFLPALRRGNVLGSLELGVAPGLLPGRVSLDAGRDWFTAAWGDVPERPGLGTAAALRAAAQGGVRALLLVGADVLGDFPDVDLARDALEAADLVVVVTGHPGPTVEQADVVLPVAVEHERPGTSTNIEGRVSRLGQKLVPPGVAWPDWMIAAELAVELGRDLGFASTEEVWREIERVAPVFSGMSESALETAQAHDGLLAPYAPHGDAGWEASSVLPVDPMATPGVESVERQGAPPRVGLAEPPGTAGPPSLTTAGDGGPVRRPSPGDGLAEVVSTLPPPHIPPADRYSLRLACPRRLYDGGNALAHSPSLVPLVPEARVRAHPLDLDTIGAHDGDRVVVRAARGSVALPCAADGDVPRGVLVVDFNLEGGGARNAAAVLIDAADVLAEVRLESAP